MDPDSPETLAKKLEAKLAEQGVRGRVVPAKLKQIVVDAPPKFYLRDESNRTTGFVLCSSPLAPDLIGRGAQRARAAREALGPELGEVVLTTTHVGSVDGLSYALLPYCDPISSNRIVRHFQRRRLGTRLLEWLASATKHTATQVCDADFKSSWPRALERIAREKFAREIAPEWSCQLAEGSWRPKSVLAHNDLWIGNVLRAPSTARWPFVMIDWLGSDVHGVPFFDLIRIAESLGITPETLKKQIDIHCDLLACDIPHAGVYLLAALGRVGLNLEQFPPARFTAMAESCWRTFTAACAR